MSQQTSQLEAGNHWRDQYLSLRKIARSYMRSERIDHTLDPTGLVHEAYLRLVRSTPDKPVARVDFLKLMARSMRLVLIDSARRRLAGKRMGQAERVPLHEAHMPFEPDLDNMLAVHQALNRLERVDPELAGIVELRCFVGLNERETGEVLGCSGRTVRRQWAIARMWLARELADDAA